MAAMSQRTSNIDCSALAPKSDFRKNIVDELEFCEILTEFFRPFVKAVIPTDEINCIRQSLECFAPCLYRETLADVYMEFIFSLFELFRTTNDHVIRNSLEEYAMRLLKRRNIYVQTLDRPRLLRRPTDNGVFAEYTEERSGLSIFIFHCQVFHDLEATQRFIRYGIHFENDYEKGLLCLLTLMSMRFPRTAIRHETRLTALIDEHYSTYEKKRRLYFTFLAVFGFKKYGENSCFCHFRGFTGFIDSLKLLFKTIPEPLITVPEITRCLNMLLVEEADKETIKGICDEFVEEFPRSSHPLQPRMLKHLCRCVLRECLRKAKKLPHGVWSLPLPNSLHDYVLLQRRSDAFHPKYVSVLSSDKRSLSNSCSLKRQKTV